MLLPASVIAPYVDLITWQVVTVAGGLFFGPAIYIIAFRMRNLVLPGGTMSFADAKVLEVEAEEEVQSRFGGGGGAPAQPSEVIKQANETARGVEEIAADEASVVEEKYRNVVEAQLSVATLARTLAEPYGGATNLKSYMFNVDLLFKHDVISNGEATRLRHLYERRKEFRDNPIKLTTPNYRGFMKSASLLGDLLAQKIQQRPPKSGTFTPIIVPPADNDESSAEELPN